MSHAELRIPVSDPAEPRTWSSTRLLGEDHLLTSWVEGTAAARFGVLHLRTGQWRVGRMGRGARGPLRDAILLPDGTTAWLLCTHGIVEVDLETLTLRRTLSAGLGTENRSLDMLGEGLVAVSARHGRTVTLVSTGSMTLVTRLRTHAPDAVVATEDGHLLMSFEAGSAREVVAGAAVGRARSSPHGSSPIVVGRRVAYVPAHARLGVLAREPLARRPPAEQERLPGVVSTLSPQGRVAWYDPRTGEREPDAPVTGAQRLLAHTPDGFLVGASDAHPRSPQELLVLSPDGGTVLHRTPAPHGLLDAVVHGGTILAAPPETGAHPVLTVVTGAVPAVDASPLPVEEANRSAQTLLSARPRRSPRTVVTDLRVEAGQQVSGLDLRRVTLERCSSARSRTADQRPVLRDVRIVDLQLHSCVLNGAVLEDVEIDGLTADARSGFVFGSELRRVTLRGRVKNLVLNPDYDTGDPETTAAYEEMYAARLEDEEWMLDISGATGDITVRGYPSRFIRRDPATQAVVTREAAASRRWLDLDFGRSTFRVALHELARSDWEDTVLVVDPRPARREDDLRVIAELRAAGLALPD